MLQLRSHGFIDSARHPLLLSLRGWRQWEGTGVVAVTSIGVAEHSGMVDSPPHGCCKARHTVEQMGGPQGYQWSFKSSRCKVRASRLKVWVNSPQAPRKKYIRDNTS